MSIAAVSALLIAPTAGLAVEPRAPIAESFHTAPGLPASAMPTRHPNPNLNPTPATAGVNVSISILIASTAT